MVVGLLNNNDLHTNDSFLTASLLPPLTSQVSSRFDYGFSGSVSDSWDVDYYRVPAPQNTGGGETVLTAMVWGLQNNGLVPRVSVFNAQQQPVSAEVLVNADGNFTVQVRNAVAGADYFVKVEAADNKGPNNSGNYFLGVDFSNQAVQLDIDRLNTSDEAMDRGSGAGDDVSLDLQPVAHHPDRVFDAVHPIHHVVVGDDVQNLLIGR